MTTAVVVFGSPFNRERRQFPQFVYQELDRAAQLAIDRQSTLILCGRGVSELMRRYVMGGSRASCLQASNKVQIEKQSSCMPDSWAALHRTYPRLRSIYVVTRQITVERYKLFGSLFFGPQVSIRMVPALSTKEPSRQLQEAERARYEEALCALKRFPPSEHGRIREWPGWDVVRSQHLLTCPQHKIAHPAVAPDDPPTEMR